MNLITCLAFSTAFSASQPYAWVLEWGFPCECKLKGIIASRTRGSWKKSG